MTRVDSRFAMRVRQLQPLKLLSIEVNANDRLCCASTEAD